MRAKDGGFTIIEVMAAGALLSALGLCILHGATILDRLSFELLLRQKAIFVLNGEMERASALYNKTAFGANTTSSTAGYTAVATIANSGTRFTYVPSSFYSTFGVNTLAAFTAANAPDSTVWMYNLGGATQNFVWLDRSRGLVARLSWSMCDVKNVTSSVCWTTGTPQPKANSTATCYGYGGGAGVCDLLTMFLDYPYTITAGVPMPLATAAATTLTLSTIVGRRE